MLIKNLKNYSKNGSGNGCISAYELCGRYKIPYSKINYYTSLGFFEIVRKEGNKRYYNKFEVERRYEMISRLINEGYPLALIRKKLSKGNDHELL